MNATEPVFVVVNLFSQMAPLDRHAIEDDLDEALGDKDLGEVTGGGSWIGKAKSGPQCNIDLEVTDFDKALKVIRRVLRKLKVDPRTEIVRYDPEVRHSVYEE